jgi:hypothetical protein
MSTPESTPTHFVIYHGQPYALVDLNPMPESIPQSETLDLASVHAFEHGPLNLHSAYACLLVILDSAIFLGQYRLVIAFSAFRTLHVAGQYMFLFRDHVASRSVHACFSQLSLFPGQWSVHACYSGFCLLPGQDRLVFPYSVCFRCMLDFPDYRYCFAVSTSCRCEPDLASGR